MLHFVVKPYDPSMNYEHFCTKLFGTNRCLAMLEKKGGDHLHIQGEPALHEDHVDYVLKEMAAVHYRRKLEPTCRPVKRRRAVADEIGFQYMAKEYDTSIVIYKQRFTDEDLRALHAESEKRREELQSKLGEYLAKEVSLRSDDTPRDLHQRMCIAGLEYYLAEGKMVPPNFKLLIRHFLLMQYGGTCYAVLEYLSDLNM